jgi:hypothetical protein
MPGYSRKALTTERLGVEEIEGLGYRPGRLVQVQRPEGSKLKPFFATVVQVYAPASGPVVKVSPLGVPLGSLQEDVVYRNQRHPLRRVLLVAGVRIVD